MTVGQLTLPNCSEAVIASARLANAALMQGTPSRAIIRDMATYRPIVARDATPIARIHATSWRSAYQGIVPDEYLDDISARDVGKGGL